MNDPSCHDTQHIVDVWEHTYVWSHTYSKSMDQPGKVVNPARGHLYREN